MIRDTSPLRYLRIHAMDVAKGPLALFVAAAAGLSFVLWRVFGSREAPDSADLLGGLVAGTLMVAVLFASGGVAGNDIKQGYYRAYFSTPMAPWWFYLQRWLLGGVAVLTIPLWLGLGLAMGFGRGTGLSAELMGNVALGYLLIGGAVLLFSTVTARDWLVVFLLYFFQGRMHDVHELLTRMGSEIPWAVVAAERVLPPFHLVSAISGGLPEGGALLHVLGYGLGMVVLALVLLRVRPLGSGGRA
jgi:hypothetical protein